MISLLLLLLFCLSVVLRSHQTAGIWCHYPEGQRAESRRPPNQLQTQGLVDIKTAILGHTHPCGALCVLWSSCCPWGGVTSYITKAALSHRKRCDAPGGCSWLGQLHMSQVRTLRSIIYIYVLSIAHKLIYVLHLYGPVFCYHQHITALMVFI